MKKYVFRPVLALLTAALLLTLAGACKKQCTNSCCNETFSASFYDVTGMVLVALDQGRTPALVLPSGGAAAAGSLALQVRPNVRLYSWQAPARPAAGGLFPAAYACLPPSPTFTEQLDSLTIRSRFDYDARHPAGTSLNDLLVATDEYRRLPLPLPDYLTQYPGQLAIQLELRLASAPAQPGRQQFVVRYRLRNGETYTALTPEFGVN